MIYLDNAATTQVDPRVLAAMNKVFKDDFGNPGTLYEAGRNAKILVETARAQTASALGARPDQIIFTSGGSEANSMVFFGSAEYMLANHKDTIAVSAVEHDSVLKAAQAVCTKHGFHLKILPVLPTGHLDLSCLEEVLESSHVGIVSVMGVNNELGTYQCEIEQLPDLCHRNGALFHTDCVQAFGTIPIQANQMLCDFLSVSSHKIHGPKGVGALYISDLVKDLGAVSPIIFGGSGQEFGLRGGTENVPGIVGFGTACSLLSSEDMRHISNLSREFLTDFLQESDRHGLLDIVELNTSTPQSLRKILSITLNGIDNETLAVMLDGADICVGTGSACRSHEVHPSHVLRAIGLNDEEAMSTIRVSFSRFNTVDEVRIAAKAIVNSCALLHTGFIGGVS